MAEPNAEAPRVTRMRGALHWAAMSRWFLAPCLVLSLAYAGCASDDDDWERHHRHDYAPACSAYTTCGTCTPVMGCGWCSYADGSGRCASGPNACGTDPFRWNWDPPTCPATTTPPPPRDDAGADVSEDASGDVATETAVDASSDDAADVATDAKACNVPTLTDGCAVTTGGSLCKDGQYTLACHGSTPSADLGCANVLSTSDGTYHCCPCR
jgi:hypothetical protein